jgi:Family of unknown function (DUF6325)
MAKRDPSKMGSIDYLVVEFPAGQAKFSGAMARELRKLIDSGQVKLLDLLFIAKRDDGSIEGFEVDDFKAANIRQLEKLAADAVGILAEDDVENLAGALEPGTIAAVLVWENAWSGPFGAAVRRSGGQLVASGRIVQTQAVLADLEAQDKPASKTTKKASKQAAKAKGA